MSTTKTEKSLINSENKEILCLKTWHYMLFFGLIQIILGFCLPIMLWQFDIIVENYGLDLGFWIGLTFIIFGLAGVIFVGFNFPSKCMVVTHFVLPIITSFLILVIFLLMKTTHSMKNLTLFDGNGSGGMKNQIMFIYCIILIVGFFIGFWSKIPNNPDSKEKDENIPRNSPLNISEQTTLEMPIYHI